MKANRRTSVTLHARSVLVAVLVLLGTLLASRSGHHEAAGEAGRKARSKARRETAGSGFRHLLLAGLGRLWLG